MVDTSSETIRMPLEKYTSLVADYCRKLREQADSETPRADELSGQINAIAAQAQALGLTLDDASVAASPQAAEMRQAMDTIMPEFLELADAARKRVAIMHLVREHTDAIDCESQTVQVPAPYAGLLIGLIEPTFVPAKG